MFNCRNACLVILLVKYGALSINRKDALKLMVGRKQFTRMSMKPCDDRSWAMGYTIVYREKQHVKVKSEFIDPTLFEIFMTSVLNNTPGPFKDLCIVC